MTLSAAYATITIATPRIRPRGRSRLGSRTSPAENVSAYQPSYVHSVAINATPNGTASASGAAGSAAPQSTAARAGRSAPPTTSAAIAPSLASVNRFCTLAPWRTPKWFVAVSTTIASSAASCAPFTCSAPSDHTSLELENAGTSAPKYSPKPTAIAAIPPVMITIRQVQP